MPRSWSVERCSSSDDIDGYPMTDTYDYVIVGAGSSGCALARRLSDEPDVTVALIEAGGADDHPYIPTPVEYFKLWGSDVDWGYRAVPQPTSAGACCHAPRARARGHEQHQRHGLPARRVERLRRLGAGRLRGLGLGVGARGATRSMEVLLQPARARRQQPALGRLHRGSGRGRLPAQLAPSTTARSTASAGTARTISKGRRNSSLPGVRRTRREPPEPVRHLGDRRRAAARRRVAGTSRAPRPTPSAAALAHASGRRGHPLRGRVRLAAAADAAPASAPPHTCARSASSRSSTCPSATT